MTHAGVQVMPELRVGVSYDRGSFLEDELTNAPLPAGTTPRDFWQEIWGFDAAFARGPVAVRGELLLDRWLTRKESLP